MANPKIVWRRAVQQTEWLKPFNLPTTGINLDLPQAPAPEVGPMLDSIFAGAATNRLASALSTVGIPKVLGATTPKDDVIGLLMLAAEVEHALMVQYLYAGQSVRGVAGRKIARVAEQEMGHLVTVQNLLLCLTGIGPDGLPAGIHLGRDGLRRASGHNPLPLILEPVSRTALAKFVVVERPGHIDDDAVRARVEALEAEVAASGADPNPVYALYAAIRWIFQKDDGEDAGLSVALGFEPGWHLTDADFVDAATIKDFSTDGMEWGSVPGLLVIPVDGRNAALEAIDAIAEQGEGIPGGDESHFQDFLSVLDSFEAGQINVSALPRTPFTIRQESLEDPLATEIENPYTLLWAKTFNSIYELLLVDIAWALSQPRGTWRTQAIDVCIDTMKRLIQPAASHLARRPLATNPRTTAGPTYEMNREDLPKTRFEFSERYTAVIQARDVLVDQIKLAPEFATDAQGQIIARTMTEIDDQRSQFLPRGE